MSIYNIYTCTVCRRSKSILRDYIYAAPNSCSITKGCAGHLLLTGESTVPSSTPTVAGITDWYPRGTSVHTAVATVTNNPVPLSTSSTGVVTLAVKMTDAETIANPTLIMYFSQRRVDEIPYTQYLFTLLIETLLINGKDITGKILRFNQTAIDEGRVIVRVNGVLQVNGVGMQLTPDKITFDIGPIGTVDVSVYTAQSTIPQSLTFTANASSAVSLNAGAWGNVKYVNKIDDAPGTAWHVYSSTGVSSLPASARLQLINLNGKQFFIEAEFLLASDPFEHADRYLEFSIPIDKLTTGYNLNVIYGTSNQLYADENTFNEVFPPFVVKHNPILADSSFLSADTFSTTSVASDITTTRFSGTKILGPV
jgi:hypothetical protein